MTDKVEEWRRNRREEEHEGDDAFGAQKISDISKGIKEDGGYRRKLGPSLEYIYLVGKSDGEKGIRELGEAGNHISEGTSTNYTRQMSSEGLVTVIDSGNKKIPNLTENGKELFQRIKPVFEPIDKVTEVKQGILEFRTRYERDPDLDELSHFLKRDVGEDEVYPTGLTLTENEKEPGKYIRYKIAAAFLVVKTSAVDANIDEGGVALLQEEKNESEVLDYKDKNREFLEGLDIKHERENLFAVELGEEAGHMLNCKEIKYRPWESEAIEKEELMELAD